MSTINLPLRVADYFIVVGLCVDVSFDSTFSVSSPLDALDVPSSPSPSRPRVAVLQRYPLVDHRDAEFPKDVMMFCAPRGTWVVEEDGEVPRPSCFSFILTEANGARVYCCALLFYEEVGETKKEGKGQKKSMCNPKCIVLTSHWPFYAQFELFLNRIFSICPLAITGNYLNAVGSLSSANGIPYPIERVISNFIWEVPLPPPGRIEVEVNVIGQIITFRRPPPNQLPNCDLSFGLLFRLLSVDNIILLFSAILSERRILFFSSHLEYLTPCAELCCAFIFPFFWQHIYIPVLPKILIDYVCAPMPFIMGVDASYLPDNLLLEGVLLVNLDHNELSLVGGSTDPLSSLPEREVAKLTRDMKKLVDDVHIPIRKDQAINEVKLKKYFLQFFIRLLKDYARYMEPPSSAIIEKFQKDKFLIDIGLKDDPFTNQFISSQMFQCFIDERIDESAHMNLNVLFFDECLDADQGKPTPFLSDTSQNHNPKYRVSALSVNRDGLEYDKYNYSFWPDLNPEFFPLIRDVAPLITNQADNQVLAKGNISKLSMNFFNEKRKFSHHFHALLLRSNKQDLLFKHIASFMINAQENQDKSIANFKKLILPAINQDTIETNTSIDSAWVLWRQFQKQHHKQFVELSKHFKGEVALPIIATHKVAESELQNLFSEAKQIDEEVGKRKTLIEQAKAKSLDSIQRCKTIRSQIVNRFASSSVPRQTGWLSSYEINRVIAAQSEANELRIAKIEAESTFRCLLTSYEMRMPQISESTRKLNTDRIWKFKETMLDYVKKQEDLLQSMQKDMHQMRIAIQAIDVEKDLESFSEGSKVFQPQGSEAFEPKRESTTETISPALDDPKLVALREKKSYAVNMWGAFATVVAHAESNRKALKTFIVSLEALADLQDTASKSIVRCIRKCIASISGASVSGNDKFLEPNMFPAGSTFFALFYAVLDRYRIHSASLAEFADALRQSASLLRITKGELKNSINMLQDHRLALRAELEAEEAKVAVLQSTYDRLCEQQSYHLSVAGNDDAQLIRAEKLDLDVNRANHEHDAGVRRLNAIKKKHDICLSRDLGMFERNETQRQNDITKALTTLCDVEHDCVRRCIVAVRRIKLRAESLDAEADLVEFVKSTYTPITPPHLKIQAGENVNFAAHLSSNTLDVVSRFTSRIATIVQMCGTFLDEIIFGEEADQKALRGKSWSLIANPLVSPSKDSSCPFVSTLQNSLDHYTASVEFLCLKSPRDKMIESMRGFIIDISKLAVRQKEFVHHAEQSYLEAVQAENAANIAATNANIAESKAYQASKTAQEKVTLAEVEDSKGTPPASSFLGFFAPSLEKLRERRAIAIREAVEKLREKELSRAKLEELQVAKAKLFSQLLIAYQNNEVARYTYCKTLFVNLSSVQNNYFDSWLLQLVQLKAGISAVDTDVDTQNFIAAFESNVGVPEWVLEEHERFLLGILEDMSLEAEKVVISTADPARDRLLSGAQEKVSKNRRISLRDEHGNKMQKIVGFFDVPVTREFRSISTPGPASPLPLSPHPLLNFSSPSQSPYFLQNNLENREKFALVSDITSSTFPSSQFTSSKSDANALLLNIEASMADKDDEKKEDTTILRVDPPNESAQLSHSILDVSPPLVDEIAICTLPDAERSPSLHATSKDAVPTVKDVAVLSVNSSHSTSVTVLSSVMQVPTSVQSDSQIVADSVLMQANSRLSIEHEILLPESSTHDPVVNVADATLSDNFNCHIYESTTELDDIVGSAVENLNDASSVLALASNCSAESIQADTDEISKNLSNRLSVEVNPSPHELTPRSELDSSKDVITFVYPSHKRGKSFVINAATGAELSAEELDMRMARARAVSENFNARYPSIKNFNLPSLSNPFLPFSNQ